jgi:hypothetical protein
MTIPYMHPSGYDVPWWKRLFGVRYHGVGRTVNTSWGEFTPDWGFRLGVGCSSDESEEPGGRASLMIQLVWGSFFIKLWKGSAWKHRDMWESYGIGLDRDGNSTLHLNWGKHTKLVDLPWAWTHVRTSVFLYDGTWGQQVSILDNTFEDKRAKETHPYHYLLNDGTVQTVDATISVREMEWRWKWLKSLPWPRLVRRTIEVEFSDEVGERRGSWKGGCLGCSYEMKRLEEPKETLLRMQRERRFC